MADDAGEFKPAADDAVAVSSKKQRFVKVKDAKGCSSLVARCRAVVVANMERYPPEMFGMLSEQDWEEILRSRHRKTAPLKGAGGLDGTGRRTPALPFSFITEVEDTNEHLADSSLADELVWKDCVEYKFSRAGLTRPRGLLLPWPVLLKQLKDQAALLGEWKKKEDHAEEEEEALQYTEEEEKSITDATQILKESTMNLTLLKESGVGKVLKKLIKASANRSPHLSIFERIKMPPNGTMTARLANKGQDTSVLVQLQEQLQVWMDLAASEGVDMGNSKQSGSDAVAQLRMDADDLRRLEDCISWRQLFFTLKDRAALRRENLGQKMRDNRKRENKMRPKIVKVKPASRRREAMLDKKGASAYTWTKGGGTVASHGGAKILSLRKEAAAQTERQKSGVPNFKKQSGFGQAVAFASNTKLTATQKMHQLQDRKRKAAALVSMGKGKRMVVPSREMRMQGTKFQNPNKKKKR